MEKEVEMAGENMLHVFFCFFFRFRARQKKGEGGDGKMENVRDKNTTVVPARTRRDSGLYRDIGVRRVLHLEPGLRGQHPIERDNSY